MSLEPRLVVNATHGHSSKADRLLLNNGDRLQTPSLATLRVLLLYEINQRRSLSLVDKIHVKLINVS